ncbi:homeodomain-like protein [Tanacetum coccineum]
MAETMEQYMSKTRADYGSGVVRPKIEDNDNFELKGQFLKELRTNTFNGSDHEDVNEHIEKVLEIADLFHIPNITIDQVMLRAFLMSLTGAARGGYRAAAPGFYQRNNANPSYQERRQSMEDTLSKFMCESAKKHEENSNLIKEIQASTDSAIPNQGASIKTLEIQIGQISKELATLKYLEGIAENVLVGIGKFVFPVDFIIPDMPEDIKVPLILERPFLSTARAKIDVYKRKINLRVREERIIFTSVKLASSLIKKIIRPFECRLHQINDLNEPFELRRNQDDDLMPTIKECEVIEEFKTRDDEHDTRIDDYPSYCDYEKKIHKDWNNVVGALMNVPIFVGTFSVVTDFIVLEDMDAYRDEGMGDVIFGEPILRDVGIKARWFEGMITIYNGNDEVTYQMVRLHPRFKHHTNEQCTKIPPLLKVSDEDKKMESRIHTKSLWGYTKKS